MGWLRVQLSEQDQATVIAERDGHPEPHVRRKMFVLWVLHCHLTREKAAEVACLGRATVQRYVAAFRQGGLDGLRRCDRKGPVSALAAHAATIKDDLVRVPARSVAEAASRIEALTGIRRGLSQTRQFMRGLGLKCQRVRAVPVPPKKLSTST